MPFGLGDQVGWEVFAADLATIPEGGLPRFVEEHDGCASGNAPQAEVSGTVLSITGLYYPQISASGQGSTVGNTIRAFSRALPTVEGTDGARACEFLVQLEIPDDTRLPSFTVNAETMARRQIFAELASNDCAMSGDAVDAALRRLADEVQQRWGHLAEIRRSPVSSAVTVIPRVEGGCVIGWVRQVQGRQDCLRIHAGEGVWVFPAGLKFVEVLGEFIAAAATGHVEELVRPVNGPADQLRTVVYAENGYSWTATTSLQPLGAGDPFVEAGSLWQRAQRGDHDYPPWAISE